VVYIKKWLLTIDLYSSSHPSRQAQVGKNVAFEADFDWLPEKMVRDFGDWTPNVSCQWRVCTEVIHSFQDPWLYSVSVNLEFDSGQQVDETISFKVY
jgi:hypothetical protein